MVIKVLWSKEHGAVLLEGTALALLSYALLLLLLSSQRLCSCSEKEDTTLHARDGNPLSLPPFHSDSCWPWREQPSERNCLYYIVGFLTSVKDKPLHLPLCGWVSNLWCQHSCWEPTLKQEKEESGTHGAGWLRWCDVTHTCPHSTGRDTPSC